jgi:hypothetical protein
MTETYYSYDGFYEAYLDGGDYNLTVTAWTSKGEGYNALSFPITMSEGSRHALNIFMVRSGMPIPEVGGPNLLLTSALALFIATICSRFRVRRRLRTARV